MFKVPTMEQARAWGKQRGFPDALLPENFKTEGKKMIKRGPLTPTTKDIHGTIPDQTLINQKIVHTGNGKTYVITGFVWLGATDEWGFIHRAYLDMDAVFCVRPLSHINGKRDNGEQRFKMKED